LQDPESASPDRGQEMLKRYLDGDPSAVAHVRQIARLALIQRGFRFDAEERRDLVQEVLLDVFRAASRPGFELQASLDAFVRSVTHRRYVDWLRSRKPGTEPGPARDGFKAPDAGLLAREEIETAKRVLLRMGGPCRTLILLRLSGKGYAEISRELGRSEGALRNQLYKCLKKARDMFRRLEKSG
jgi:RNA polymerase sigma factor (sigma-70 family)